MTRETMSVMSFRSKHSANVVRRNRSLRPLDHPPEPPVDELLIQLSKFRVDGRTINARNVDELFPGLDRLLLRCLQTGDSRQLDNRLRRNLKAEYLLITGQHIRLSVACRTQNLLQKLIEMGATLDLHFYEPVHVDELELLCKYGCDINIRLSKHNHQTPLAYLITKNSSLSMLQILVRHGARFDLQDNQGQTPVHCVCQSNVTDSVFEFIIRSAPDFSLNIRNQFGGTPLDLTYLMTYENPTMSRMRRLHTLLARKQCKLTRYGMREPNLIVKKQYKLLDVLATKEFLFKYRLRDVFDPSVRSLTWCLFLFYDVLRACEQTSSNSQQMSTTIQSRLERYLISMIENGEISLDKLIFRPQQSFVCSTSSLSSTPTTELEQDMLTDTQNSLKYMTHVKNRLNTLRMETLTLKAICRIKVKKEIENFPNDVVKLPIISKVLQGYLTYYNPFVKSEVTI